MKRPQEKQQQQLLQRAFQVAGYSCQPKFKVLVVGPVLWLSFAMLTEYQLISKNGGRTMFRVKGLLIINKAFNLFFFLIICKYSMHPLANKDDGKLWFSFFLSIFCLGVQQHSWHKSTTFGQVYFMNIYLCVWFLFMSINDESLKSWKINFSKVLNLDMFKNHFEIRSKRLTHFCVF